LREEASPGGAEASKAEDEEVDWEWECPEEEASPFEFEDSFECLVERLKKLASEVERRLRLTEEGGSVGKGTEGEGGMMTGWEDNGVGDMRGDPAGEWEGKSTVEGEEAEVSVEREGSRESMEGGEEVDGEEESCVR
jgi:hypothetical protein